MLSISRSCIICLILSQAAADTRDVVFVLDRSGSVNQEDFNEAIDFVYNITKWLTIGSSTGGLQISIISFSNTVIEEFDLDDYTTKPDLLDAINSVKSRTTGGGTNTDVALSYSYQTSFSTSHGSRNGVSRTVVVLTDGISNSRSQTETQATVLHNDGIEVFAVGIGFISNSSLTELRAIASDPDSYYVNTVGTFSNLCLLVPELVPKLDSTIAQSAIDICGHYNTTEEPDNSKSTDNTAIIAGVASVVVVVVLAGIIFGIVKAMAAMSASVQIPTILAAVGKYGPAPLGPSKAKFTTKFGQSGLPHGNIIASHAPLHTYISPQHVR